MPKYQNYSVSILNASITPQIQLFKDSTFNGKLNFKIEQSSVCMALVFINIKEKKTTTGFPIHLEEGIFSFEIDSLNNDGLTFFKYDVPQNSLKIHLLQKEILTLDKTRGKFMEQLKFASSKEDSLIAKKMQYHIDSTILKILFVFTNKNPHLTYPFAVLYGFFSNYPQTNPLYFERLKEVLEKGKNPQYYYNQTIISLIDSTFFIKNVSENSLNTNLALNNSNDRSLLVVDTSFKLNILCFWASWCGPCLKELPELKEAMIKFKNYSFRSISLDKNVQKWKNAIENNQMTWVQLIDDETVKLAPHLKVFSIPYILAIDKSGKVLKRTNNLKELSDFLIKF